MDLKKLFTDERAVSPVIGVILMVAITVILAAVIGAFVLGIGGDQEQTPQASISLDLDPDAGEIEIAHNGGQTLELDDVGMSLNGSFDDGTDPLTEAEDADAGDTLSSGETLDLDDNNDFDSNDFNEDTTVRVVHQPTGGILASGTA